MFHDPVEEGFLEANVVTDFLALYPLAEDFFAFSEEFLEEISSRDRVVRQ
jgi:hypothetical protein